MPVPVLNGYRLGRKSYDRTRPNVMLRRLRGATLSPPPARDWGCDAMDYMALNDELGCCTMSAKSHILTGQEFFGQSRGVVVPDSETLRGYSAVSGYDPKSGRNDNGATIQDSYDYMRKVGYTVGGVTYRFESFAELDVVDRRAGVDHDLVKTCIDAFGAVDIGMVFPDFAMDQFDNNQVWDYTPRMRYQEEGGHDVCLVGYGGSGAGSYYDCWTWSKRQRITVPFVERFFEEFWTQGEKDWQRPDGTVPNGIDGASAQVQFEQLTRASGPGWDGVGPVTPPVEPPVDPPVEPPVNQDSNWKMAAAIDDFAARAAIWRIENGV